MNQRSNVEIEARSMVEIAREWEGQVVDGEFHLHRYLGGSDHSVVFLTDYNDHATRQAAIKFILTDSEDAEQLTRWEFAADLCHPHLLRIFQAGRCRLSGVDLLYVVMEYAEEDLSQILPERALTAEETRAMLAATLNALAYIHGEGLVHSRIRPSNIMAAGDQLKLSIDRVCPSGEAAAKLSPRGSPEAPTGALWPENDVWALGILLVEVLTQKAPAWDRSTQTEPLIPETLPAPFLDIARNCLRTNARRRWALSDIALGMEALPPRDEQTASQVQTSFANRNDIAKAVAVALFLTTALAVAVAGPKLLHRRPRPQPSAVALDANPNPVESGNRERLKTAAVHAEQLNPGRNVHSPSKPPSALRQSAAQEPLLASKTDQAAILRQVLPGIPAGARDTIHGTVRVRVKVSVDPSGAVQEAVLDAPGPSKFFAQLSLQAAKQWKFSPSKPRGQDTSSEWLLRFEFSATDTRVVAAQMGSPRLP